MSATTLTAELAREWLHYNPVTGCFKWRKSPKYDILPFMEAGSVNGRGYVQISLLGGKYTGHRLAWLIHFGSWPTQVLDHINGRPADNRIDNLRDVPQTVNMQNKRQPACKRGFVQHTAA